MKTFYRVIAFCYAFFSLSLHISAQTFTYNSSTTVTVPVGITTVTAKVLGAGENGTAGSSSSSGNGGGGAGFCLKIFAVQAGQTINIVVGTSGGSKTSSVTHSESSTNLIANGGSGTTGGTATGGSINFSGGNGSGGGGQAACEFGNGASAVDAAGGLGGVCGNLIVGGIQGSPAMIGMGLPPMPGFPGVAGSLGSGGGGGGSGGNGGPGGGGGSGGNGQVILVMSCTAKSITLTANNGGTQSAGVRVTDHNSLDFTNALTIEAWIKPTAFESHLWKGSIVAKDNWANANQSTGYVLRCGGNGVLDFTYGSSTVNAWNSFTSATGALTVGVWQHVAVTFQQNVGVKMYVNGVQLTLAATGAFTSTIATNNQDLGIGTNYYDDKKRNFNGQIDEVRIWNVARTAIEIASFRQRELCSSTSLVANYRFDANITVGATGGVINAVSGGAGNGTLAVVGGTATQDCDGIELTTNIATKLYVKANATGQNNGTSWADAHTDLQNALSEARVCTNFTEVWVAAGTYKPTSTTDRTIAFQMKNNLAIYGGFVGNETLLSERNWKLNPTILSGDIDNDNFTDGQNSYHVIYNHGTQSSPIVPTAVLDGFRVRGGNADGTSGLQRYGGGMLNIGAGPTVRNCIFENNTGADAGGGVYASNALGITFYNCIFRGNLASDAGGGLATVDFTTISLYNCVFYGNYVTNIIYTGLGGGAYFNNSQAFMNNCTVSGNYAGSGGGGIMAKSEYLLTPSANSRMLISNSIIWGNGTYGPNAREIGISSDFTFPIQMGVSSSIVMGGYTPPLGFTSCLNCPNTNGNLDPKFVSQPAINLGSTGDLRLQPCSGAINIGNSNGMTLFDLDDNPRIYNTTVDLGAYEFQGNYSTTAQTVSTNYSTGTHVIANAQTISATNLVNPPSNITYQAGKSVMLNAGFKADAGAVFVAKIGSGCL